MNEGTAERWLVTSALVVGGLYAYGRWKGTTKTSFQKFGTAWGVTYLILALMTEASPQFGGSFAILVMVGDILANGQALFAPKGPVLGPITSTLNTPPPAGKPAATKATVR
jgi:hypothetical protein